jgi:site-specific DNA-adenine methylase
MGVTASDIDARMGETLKAPFPWFGGKSRAASLIWDRLGNVDTYNEPFAGSLAVLLSRPHEPRVETVNDVDAYLANFWRALQADPEQVAYYADYPVNETDLHARHQWLVKQSEFVASMKADPEFYDAKIAGWWVWGQCLWIGSGWCQRPDWEGRGVGAAANRGVHNQAMSGKPTYAARVDQKRPKLREGDWDGVGGSGRRWQGGGQGGGSGVHAPRLTDQMPRLAAEGGSISGVTATPLVASGGLYDYLTALSVRLRRVRVCCGDWKRVLTPSVTTYVGLCGVLLDPPYSHDMRERCYSEDHDISGDVREWAIANGDNPEFRIALCGYEGEHTMPDTWECVAWKAHGGYARTERGKENRERERIWFSPFCLKSELPLFADQASA